MTGREHHSETRILSPQQLIAWAEGSVNAVRLRTYRDAIPGGFMAALAPARIEWKSSDPYGEQPFVIVRHPEAVPERIPLELADAGLIEKKDGKAWVVKYSHNGIKPYDSSGMCGMDHDS